MADTKFVLLEYSNVFFHDQRRPSLAIQRPAFVAQRVITTPHELETLAITMEFVCPRPQKTKAFIDRCMNSYRGHERVKTTIAELNPECCAKIITHVVPATTREGNAVSAKRGVNQNFRG